MLELDFLAPLVTAGQHQTPLGPPPRSLVMSSSFHGLLWAYGQCPGSSFLPAPRLPCSAERPRYKGELGGLQPARGDCLVFTVYVLLDFFNGKQD